MLHKRYDWRRTVFTVSVCLTLFLSSQTSHSVQKETYLFEPVNGINVKSPDIIYETGVRSNYKEQDHFFYIVRR